MQHPSPTDTASADLLAKTIHALQGGLTSIPLSDAMETTEIWQQQFLQSGQPELQNIAREFGNLQELLSSGILDGPIIGRSLSMLGAQTSELMRTAPEERKMGLNQLSTLLLRIGGELEADNNGRK
ncbi:hypothetical protein F0P96_11465 [Hymenobacter busanensis]|uniref:Uncharacterized protein n=1 Tax=Hymenobacter busanensis TaxID=2607656 RepID=A0A7L4ZZJ8_9BACT|nr:hypothetical protein [Hymenobacter busanensis]KAA9332099.1 hypothetical protein F0P96_11465 [Hymenobacter busanensis]QHJ07562.1 hypothetical protein GUY19_09805 [Hymenobacter busanensis]